MFSRMLFGVGLVMLGYYLGLTAYRVNERRIDALRQGKRGKAARVYLIHSSSQPKTLH